MPVYLFIHPSLEGENKKKKKKKKKKKNFFETI